MIYFLLSFISGFLIKSVDWIEDEEKGKNKIKWVFAFLAGLILAVLINKATFATLFVAGIAAQVIARKLDKPTHVLTGILGLGGTAFGVLNFEPFHFLLFLVAGIFDEQEIKGKYSFITEYRLFLKAAAAFFILQGRWDYFLGILLFDSGYLSIEHFLKKKKI